MGAFTREQLGKTPRVEENAYDESIIDAQDSVFDFQPLIDPRAFYLASAAPSSSEQAAVSASPITAYPYDCVCYITDTIPNSGGNPTYLRGSGVIIGPHTILTASHVLWSYDYQHGASQISVYPGYNNGSGTAISGTWTTHFFQVNDLGGTLSSPKSQNDYAIIDFSSNLSSYGSFGVQTNFTGGTVHLTGYPSTAGTSQTDQVGTVNRDPNYSVLNYGTVTSNPGNSGGPVWVDAGTAGNPLPYVVGVVSTSGWAAQLTSSDWTTIQGWISSDQSLWGGGTSGADILWRNNSSGAVYDATMSGAQRTGFNNVGGDANWSVVGTGDFNGDGMSDILWRYSPTGGVFDAQMNGSQRTGFNGVGGDANWSVVGTGDFNGDGMSDILWRYSPTGGVFDDQMNGSQRTGSYGVGGDANWSVVGTGDFNGDGNSDILWRYNPTGGVFDAQMNGSQRTGFYGVGGDANWSVVGTGDFNGDGNSDILWRYNLTGGVFDAQMNGSQRTGFVGVGGDANWSVAGTGDFNGDGMSDILWRNNASGAVFDAQMNGSQRTGFFGVGGDTNWNVVG